MASKKAKPKPVPLEVVEHADGTEPDAFILTDDERRIVEYCRTFGLTYHDARRQLKVAARDTSNSEDPVDHPDFIALRDFRHRFGALLESAMDNFGGPIAWLEVEHCVRDVWVFVANGEIDGRQFNAEIQLREAER